MAKIVLTDPSVVINSVDLSDHVEQVTINDMVDEVETTAADGSGARSRMGGLSDGDVSITFHQDFAAASTEATLRPLMGTTTSVVVKPTSASVGSTNPSYTADYLVKELPVIDASMGELVKLSVSWPRSGALTKAES